MQRFSTSVYRETFLQLFPERERVLVGYEKRVETLKTIGSVTSEGPSCTQFRMHVAFRHELIPPSYNAFGSMSPTRARARRATNYGARRGLCPIKGACPRIRRAAREFDRVTCPRRSRPGTSHPMPRCAPRSDA